MTILIKRVGNENILNMGVNMMLRENWSIEKELTEVGYVIIKYFPNQLDLKGESIDGKIYPSCSNRKRQRWLFCNVSGFTGLLLPRVTANEMIKIVEKLGVKEVSGHFN